MGPTTSEIEAEIENKREDLLCNLQELETRVKSVTDWRRHYRNNPAAALGLAFGGGLLLAGLVGGRPSSRRGVLATRAELASGVAPGRHLILRSWDGIQNALIGLAASKVAETLCRVVPGFKEHFGGYERSGNPAGAEGHRDDVQGEGDYRSAARYRRAAERFAQREDVERAAREAAPKSDAEAREMAAAEQRGRARAKGS